LSTIESITAGKSANQSVATVDFAKFPGGEIFVDFFEYITFLSDGKVCG
jgi:hypothetical protein